MQNPEMAPELGSDFDTVGATDDQSLPELPDLPGDMPADLGGDFAGGMPGDMPDLSGGGGPERREETEQNAYRRSIFDVPVTVNVSVGRKKLSVAELLELKPDTVIALAANLEDPIDLTIDDRVIARGELIETEDGTLAVRITEIEERSNG